MAILIKTLKDQKTNNTVLPRTITTAITMADGATVLEDKVNSKADLTSPTFTGTPTAPTSVVGTNTTQIATTAFVNAEIASDAAPISHVGSTGNAHGVATTEVNGFMSSIDKTKLDGIATNANNYTHPSGFTNEPTAILSGANVISQIQVTSEGHVDAVATRALTPVDISAEPAITTKNTAFNKNYGTSTSDVKMDGTASVGSVDDIARIDHVHPTDTSREPLISPKNTAFNQNFTQTATDIKMNGVQSVGTSDDVPRADHVHPTDTSRASASDLTSHTGNTSNPHSVTAAQVGAEPTIATKNTAFNKNYETTDTNIKMNGTQAVGTLDTIARGDHVHPTDTSRASATHTHAQSDITNLVTDLASKATTAEYTCSLPASGWVGSSAPYTQAVTVTGILAGDDIECTPIYSETNATAILESASWNMVRKGITSADTITFTCFETKPTQNLSLFIKVVR